MAMKENPTTNCHYFIAKCGSVDSLRRCVKTCKWASRVRSIGLQPHLVLTEALSKGQVILIFSVNNCHGWHGYCYMKSQPKASSSNVFKTSTVSEQDDDKVVNENSERFDEGNAMSMHDKSISPEENIDGDNWQHFDVEWKTEFISEFGERCLSSSETTGLFLMDGSTPLNKARNWQEVPEDVGRQVCSLIDNYFFLLKEKRREVEEAKVAAKPPPFIKMETDNVAEATENYWRIIVEKVERELGTVHLACPFGSQR